jgi:hypothetical protein
MLLVNPSESDRLALVDIASLSLIPVLKAADGRAAQLHVMPFLREKFIRYDGVRRQAKPPASSESNFSALGTSSSITRTAEVGIFLKNAVVFAALPELCKVPV